MPGLDAGAVLEAVAGSGAAVLEAVAGSGAAVLEAVAGPGAAVLEAVAGSGAAVLDVVAVLEPVAGSGAGAEADASAEPEAEAVSSAGAGSDVGGGSDAGCGSEAGGGAGSEAGCRMEAGGGAGSDAGCGSEAGGGAGSDAGCGSEAGGGAGSEAGCGSEAGGGAGSDAGGGPDAAPTRGIASKRFENFIPSLVAAPRSSCFSLFVAGDGRSPVCCQEPNGRPRRCMSVCTAFVTPRTGLLAVVLPRRDESLPTSVCAAALLESAWATAIAAQELPINRQAATMQTPAAKRKRAATTISPPPKTATSQTFATLLHIPADIGPARLSTRATVAGKSPFTTRRLNLQDQAARLLSCGPSTDIAGLGDVVERAAGALGRPDILVNSRIRPSPPCRD